MRADDFLMRSSDDEEFDANYNLIFRVVDHSALGLLEPIQKLFEVSSAI